MSRRIGWPFLLTLLALCAACATKHPSLSARDLRQCRASGGYEGGGPFGERFCQYRYADAGKSCRGKADCLGQCLSDPPADVSRMQVGTPVSGRCAAERTTFGCFGRVEDGKLAEPYICVD